jgi:hypothetical protein
VPGACSAARVAELFKAVSKGLCVLCTLLCAGADFSHRSLRIRLRRPHGVARLGAEMRSGWIPRTQIGADGDGRGLARLLNCLMMPPEQCSLRNPAQHLADHDFTSAGRRHCRVQPSCIVSCGNENGATGLRSLLQTPLE